MSRLYYPSISNYDSPYDYYDAIDAYEAAVEREDEDADDYRDEMA